ncbi:MAG: helix-turn-helix domain-containing protein [Hyphomicrobiaceae bacterium]
MARGQYREEAVRGSKAGGRAVEAFDGSRALRLPARRSVKRIIIEQTVAQVFGVAGCDLRCATRGRAKVARARQVAMYLAHVSCSLSLTEVGRLFERDRTTVAHACSVVEDERDDPMFDRVLELLDNAVVALVGPRAISVPHDAGWLVQ